MWLRLRPATVRGKLVAMALATTFVALLATAAGMLAYDLDSYQQYWVDDMTTQAEIIAVVSSPALSFNDPAAARQNLGMLRVRPHIEAGAIYDARGVLFAGYAQSPQDTPVFPARPGKAGHAIEGGHLVVYHPVVENGEVIGTVYLIARYGLVDRIRSYAAIMGGVMLFSLLLAALVARRLQQGITQPLAAVTGVARAVMEKRDFSLRVRSPNASGEIATLVYAFNDMLAEVGRRAYAQQEANRTLQHEMTVRQDAERALLVADRRKDEFLATLAHELRNPLAPIRTGLDILRMAGDDKVACERARAIMERQLRQMVRLVDDLLDVSRINTGKLTIKREPVALQSVVGDALELVRPFVEAQEHRLQVELPQEPVYVLGDATRLAQVLSNLLNNAAKYTNSGGELSLRATVEEGQLKIRVSDNGIGVAPHMLGEIFEMFVQADTSLERSTAGLGVGLSLARRLAELHGGTITAESQGIGQGSTLTVTLPVMAAPDDPAAAVPPSARQKVQYRVLLADDNVDFVDSIAVLLRGAGHTVRVCHDGAQALAAADAFVPDYAFLDIGLPRMNGYDLARALRKLPGLQRTVLVAVTGWGQQKDRQLALDAGFNAHLVKPVGAEQILAIMAGSREGLLLRPA
jgi:signal transduction histidine kinase/ActR/RegA family two-component response regulator